MKVSMKGRYETKKSNGPFAHATLSFNAGAVKLRACFHSYKKTILDGTLVLDSANKLSANHALGSTNCKLKYTYVHEGLTTFEPCYDLAKNSWDFAVARKVYGDHVLRAWYQTSSQVLGLEWSRNSKQNGSSKHEIGLRNHAYHACFISVLRIFEIDVCHGAAVGLIGNNIVQGHVYQNPC